MNTLELYKNTCKKYYFNKLIEREPQETKYRAIKEFLENNFPNAEYEKIAEDSEEWAISMHEFLL